MPHIRTLARVLADPRAAVAAVAAGALTALAVAVPTSVLPNPFFIRMTPTRPQDVVLLWLTAVLAGLLAATYVRSGEAAVPIGTPAGGGGVLSFLAIGCPVCNKAVVLLLGASGALTYFAPLQPLIGALGVALLAWALLARVRALTACGPIPRTREAPPVAT